MKFQLVTLLGVKVDKDIYGVTIPTKAGEISVFEGHESLVTLAQPGVLSVRFAKNDSDEKLELFAISGGVVEVNKDQVKVLVDEADQGDDIIESESKAGLERAIKLREKATNQIELEEATQMMDRHAVRLKVASLRRHKRR